MTVMCFVANDEPHSRVQLDSSMSPTKMMFPLMPLKFKNSQHYILAKLLNGIASHRFYLLNSTEKSITAQNAGVIKSSPWFIEGKKMIK